MARPENRSEARALSLTLPIETFNYLALLATLWASSAALWSALHNFIAAARQMADNTSCMPGS